MTEAEWLTCDDPAWMLALLRGAVTDRKRRLFAVACCRRLWHAPGTAYLKLLSAAEMLADGRVGGGFAAIVLRHAGRAWGHAGDGPAVAGARLTLSPSGHEAAARTLHHCVRAEVSRILSAVESGSAGLDPATQAAKRAWDGEIGHERYSRLGWNEVRNVAKAAAEAAVGPAVQAGFAADLREVIGPSLTPVALSPCWLTPTVTALASAIYADRAFDRLPVLADALEEAGCNDDDVLIHCRGDGPHCRGCWVVDLVLGKERP